VDPHEIAPAISATVMSSAGVGIGTGSAIRRSMVARRSA
jgi:hypothetical protein